jgi:hypothetical protein
MWPTHGMEPTVLEQHPTQEPAAPVPARRRARQVLSRLGRMLVFLLSLGMLFPHAFSDDDED